MVRSQHVIRVKKSPGFQRQRCWFVVAWLRRVPSRGAHLSLWLRSNDNDCFNPGQIVRWGKGNGTPYFREIYVGEKLYFGQIILKPPWVWFICGWFYWCFPDFFWEGWSGRRLRLGLLRFVIFTAREPPPSSKEEHVWYVCWKTDIVQSNLTAYHKDLAEGIIQKYFWRKVTYKLW